MISPLVLTLTPEEAGRPELLTRAAARALGVDESSVTFIRLLKRSIDARGGKVRVRLVAEVTHGEPPPAPISVKREYPNVRGKPHAVIVGSGPAGLFAALRLMELGVRPVVLERGKDVAARRKDLVALNRDHVVNPESNYCFGEGGAGTYSDGKLTTRSKKRGEVGDVLATLVAHGAPDEILFDALPHIGSDRLPKVVANLGQSIRDGGGEIHFNTRVTDLVIENGGVRGVRTADGDIVDCRQIILATGHSARDVFELLARRGIEIEAKPFALGVRVEHPQTLIDSIQYSCRSRDPWLPPASYRLAQQIGGRGVYSFCMCPGGVIAPCATAPGEIVTNGWSSSGRRSPRANAGIVVSLGPADFGEYAPSGPLAALRYQQTAERAAFAAGGGGQTAPAQRMVDFVEGRLSTSLPASSYRPGTISADLGEVLPPLVRDSLRLAFKAFGRRMKGYFTNEALLHAVESRTSSPVRIPRDGATLEHRQVRGLYPCGEGAGYAGGIVSSAMDGVKCAERCGSAVGRR